MLSSNQKNVKVHFAGSDGEEIFYAALTCAKTNYRLYSCYKYIFGKSVNDDFTLPRNHVIIDQSLKNKHVIQDSGLFTLMFGAGKNQKHDKKSLIEWQDKLIRFITDNKLSNVTCVEMDCQKLLGPEETWYFRERMKRALSNRQINVFHFEDGKEGLDRLIDFSDYIAFSVPELRIIKPKQFKQYTYKLVQYTKDRKPDIDIHLLGCTDFSMLAQNKFVTSADSTSWLQGVKYGYISDGSTKEHVRNFKKDLFNQRHDELLKILNDRHIKLKPKTLDYCTNASISATICKQRYEKVAGDQS